MLEQTKRQVKVLFLSRNTLLYCYIVYERQHNKRSRIAPWVRMLNTSSTWTTPIALCHVAAILSQDILSQALFMPG